MLDVITPMKAERMTHEANAIKMKLMCGCNLDDEEVMEFRIKCQNDA